MASMTYKSIMIFLLPAALGLGAIAGEGDHIPLAITRLTGDFFVFTTYQPIRGEPYPANGMYLVTAEGVVLFDTPWDTTQCQPLLDSIMVRHGKRVVMAIATHSHADRTGGLGYYRRSGIRTYTTATTDSLSKARGEHRAEFLMPDDTTFSVGGHVFRSFFPGEGHSTDNIIVWFERERILYGGCLIKSVKTTGLGNLSDAKVTAWPRTIKNMQRMFGTPAWIITGHQDWTRDRSLDHTLLLLRQHGEAGKH